MMKIQMFLIIMLSPLTPILLKWPKSGQWRYTLWTLNKSIKPLSYDLYYSDSKLTVILSEFLNAPLIRLKLLISTDWTFPWLSFHG